MVKSTFSAMDQGLISGHGIKIPQAIQCIQYIYTYIYIYIYICKCSVLFKKLKIKQEC